MLERVLSVPPGLEARVYEAMRYSALAPASGCGRFSCWPARGCSAWRGAARLQVAAAIEMVHAYSLIHDDLPAMDNSDLRRGRPTCHKQFDEATAVLAGDGLLTMAFEVLADPDTHGDPAVRCELVAALAARRRRRRHGRRPDDRPDCREAGARYRRDHPAAADEDRRADRVFLRGRRDSRQGGRRSAHGAAGYAHDLGLAFQIADDLLDIEGSAAETGKPVGADAAAGKATFVSILGASAPAPRPSYWSTKRLRILICSNKERNFYDKWRDSSINRRT